MLNKTYDKFLLPQASKVGVTEEAIVWEALLSALRQTRPAWNFRLTKNEMRPLLRESGGDERKHPLIKLIVLTKQ